MGCRRFYRCGGSKVSGGGAVLVHRGLGLVETVKISGGAAGVTQAAAILQHGIPVFKQRFTCKANDVMPLVPVAVLLDDLHFVYLHFVIWFCAWGRVALFGAARPRCPAAGLLGGAVNAVIERSTAARAGIRHITVVVAEQSRATYAATGVSVPIFVNSALSIFPFAHDLFLLIFVFGLPSSAPGGHSRRTAPAGRFGLGFVMRRGNNRRSSCRSTCPRRPRSLFRGALCLRPARPPARRWLRP